MHGCREAVPGREVGGEAGLALRRCRQGRARAWGLIWYFSLITVIKISWMVCAQFSVFISPIFFTDLTSSPRATVAFVARCDCVHYFLCFCRCVGLGFYLGALGVFHCMHN